jgi:hypothetical protein
MILVFELIFGLSFFVGKGLHNRNDYIDDSDTVRESPNGPWIQNGTERKLKLFLTFIAFQI